MVEVGNIFINLIQQVIESACDLHNGPWPLEVKSRQEGTNQVTQEQELLLSLDPC